MKNISRRDFLNTSIAGCSLLFLPKLSWAFSAKEAEPHFFIQVMLLAGADPTYLFDARPLAMTQAGKIQNYLGEDPKPYLGVNGTSCLCTSITNPLQVYRDYFSVVNGVHMATTFDGHPQNELLLQTGNPFGGEYFIPHLSKNSDLHSPLPMDAISSGFSFSSGSYTNGGEIVPLGIENARILLEKLGTIGGGAANAELEAHLQARLVENSRGGGRFSEGALQMLNAHAKAPELKAKLVNLKLPPKPEPGKEVSDQQLIEYIASIFKSNISRAAIINPNEFFDTHDPRSAAGQPELFKKTVARIAAIFKTLLDTPYDDKRSMMDVTTVMITSEFSRTMRQELMPIDKTGTDHNPLNNSVILAGKGIKGGMVLGASDFSSADEALSKAHLSLDAKSLKMMGRPFDFSTMQPVISMPELYAAKNYLNIGSVVNTLYSLFGVHADKYREIARNEGKAPILRTLLK